MRWRVRDAGVGKGARIGCLDAGVFIALACQGRWRARDAGVGLTLALGKGARIGSLTLAFLLWSVTDALAL